MPRAFDDERYMEEGAEIYDYVPGRKVQIAVLGMAFAAACLAVTHCVKTEKEPVQYVEAVPIVEPALEQKML